MSDAAAPSAQHLRFAPRRWRRWFGFAAFAVLLVPIVITTVVSVSDGTGVPLAIIIAAVPPVVGALYLRNLTRAIVVVPGVEIRWRGAFFAVHRVRLDDSTVIEWYAMVDGSLYPMRRVRTPIGTIDSKWATITSTGSPVLRLSMRLWRESSLAELASATSARLRIHNEPKDPNDLARDAPYVYTWLEKRPRLFQAIYVVLILLSVWTIIVDVDLIASGFRW